MMIKVRNGESLDQALRRFNMAVRQAGILEEIKLRRYYEKPSSISRKKQKQRERLNNRN